ncbi:NAD(P)/FAD-dependent oxidoreductase [Natrarchaeobius sp. A-rgal3]|uniref:NAD(P)/FAD-dependent oxidoreductase n=1 Tax=Natrarchaeobius versutus TaxID=1679078 RepID=UPI003510AB34
MSKRGHYDSVVIGGGPAGLSAGLLLGRSGRNTVVCDSGEYRNDPSTHVWSFLTRDGVSPSEFRELGRREVGSYETVEYRPDRVTDVEAVADGFAVTIGDAEDVSTRTIVLATGLSDAIPPIHGVDDLWGERVLHCPYCHGWDVRDESFAVFAPNEQFLHYVKILLQWSDDLTVLTHGESWITDETNDAFDANDISVVDDPISRVDRTDRGLNISLESGETLARDVLWVYPDSTQRSPIAESLGCSFTQEGIVETDERGRSSVDGVYVAGDAGRPSHQVSFAVSDGAMAGITINADLAAEEFGSR